MTKGPRRLAAVEATETELGVVQLAVIGDSTPRLAVQGNDPRLVQRGTAFPTDFLAVRVGTLFCRTDLANDPVYRYNGDTSAWDLVGGGGSATWTETEIDLGATPLFDATITVTDAAVTGASKIAVVASGSAPTGLAVGEDLWDALTFAALAASGSFVLYVHAAPGPVSGKRKILYQVS